MESRHSKKNSSKNKVSNSLKSSKTKKNNGASAAPANNALTVDFFDVVDVKSALASKIAANTHAIKDGKKEVLDEKKARLGIAEQHDFTTSKIQQLVSDGFITSKGIKNHVFSKFDKVILVDFENLWNVTQRYIETIISIINTIHTTPSKTKVLFIFIMATYHRSNDLFNTLVARFNKSVSSECIYIDRNVDNLSEPICMDKYGFNESDDYLLLKVFKYLSHVKIPVEILSADQYSYKKNIKLAYLYLSESDKSKIMHKDPFNPHEYYMQFNKATANAAGKRKSKMQSNTIDAPMFLRITGERKKMTKDNIVYYSEGSQYNKSTNILTYNNEHVGVGSVAANGNIYMENGIIEFANGKVQYSDGTLVYPFGKVIYINGDIDYPDDTNQDPDGIINYPDGTLEYPDGVIQYPDGTLEYPDGTLEYPDGTLEYPDGVIQYTDGRLEYPN